MRRRIELYIDGHLADLSDQELILYNYAVTDLEKPTAVRNSYSKQITLPGTPANDAIFSHSHRVDRFVGTSGFNPLVRTPFAIMNTAGEVLQSGYLKLDRVDVVGPAHSYIVTLYGGLGSLIYGLTYDENGEKLNLASLPFSVPDSAFWFIADKDSVFEAWARLYDGSSGSTLWDTINFAPCYNGIPASLQSDKGRLDADYTKVVTLSRKFTEVETRDMRANLQRPVVNVPQVLAAITTKAAALGYSMTLDPAFFNAGNPYYSKAWQTLKLMTEYNKGEDKQIGVNSHTIAGEDVGQVMKAPIIDDGYLHVSGSTFHTVGDSMDFSAFSPAAYLKAPAGISCRMVPENIGGLLPSPFYLGYHDAGAQHFYGAVIGMQARVVAGGTTVATSRPVLMGDYPYGGDQRTQDVLDYLTADYADALHIGNASRPDGSFDVNFFFTQPINVSASNNVRIIVEFVSSDDGLEEASMFRLYASDVQDGTNYVTGELMVESGGGILQLMMPGRIGTATVVTKDMLLADTCTPADFLLSYCRQFGLKIVETGPKKVSILATETFYNGGIMDASARVDRSSMKVSPLYFQKKWQRLGLPIPETQKAADYRTNYGKDFGMISLDTGLEFNRETEELLAGSAFVGGISGKDFSASFYNWIGSGGEYIAPALLSGYTDEGVFVAPAGFRASAFNSDFPGYDGTSRLYGYVDEGGEKKPVNISGTLLFFSGVKHNPIGKWWLTDNYPGDEICWQFPTANDAYSKRVVNLPEFSRYMVDDGVVTHSWDFSTPAEIYDPGAELTTASSIYTRFWEPYARDRFNKSNKVLAAKVDLRGLQVGPDLLRRFFWYDGVLWALNKITNYSLTTLDPAECEFVQVQDMANYTDGQNE